MATFPDYGAETTGTEVASAFSDQIKGKYVLLAGVSPGSIGENMAIAIAKHKPALLILASRTLSKITSVVTQIASEVANLRIGTIEVDLSSQESIRKAADLINSMTLKLDIIINNAGLNVPDRQLTKEGIEMHFGTNHIGLFLLTNLLLPRVLVAAEGAKKGASRIVNLSSEGHRLSPIRFSDYNFERTVDELPVEEQPRKGLPTTICDPDKPYSSFLGYGQSKTANILFSVALNEKLRESGILSFAVHPGSIWTGLARDLDENGQAMIKATSKVWKNGDQGAATALVAAFDPALDEAGGIYLSDCQYKEALGYAIDQRMAERLWQLSEKLAAP